MIRRLLNRLASVDGELRQYSTLENPSTSLVEALSSDALEIGGGGGGPTYTGKRITTEGSLRMLAVYAAVRVLAEGVGQLPLHLFEKVPDPARPGRKIRNRLHEEDDPRAFTIGEEPNPEITAQTLWELATGHMNLWGNAYLLREVDGVTGLTRYLWPLPPNQTEPARLKDGSLVYLLRLESGEERLLFPDEVIHFRAFGTGDVGISPIGVARQAIGIALAQEEYTGRFYANDATPTSYVTTEQTITDAQYERARRRHEARHRSLANKHLIDFLDNGARIETVGFPLKDAEFIETRKFQVREIARLFRVPPYKLADLEAGSVSYASVEVQQIDFLTDSLNPWLTRFERGLKRTMFSSELDRARGLYPEFLRAAGIMGDFKSTLEALEIGVRAKLLTQNEGRERLNLPPVEGGDEFPKVPAQLQPPADDNGDQGDELEDGEDGEESPIGEA